MSGSLFVMSSKRLQYFEVEPILSLLANYAFNNVHLLTVYPTNIQINVRPICSVYSYMLLYSKVVVTVVNTTVLLHLIYAV